MDMTLRARIGFMVLACSLVGACAHSDRQFDTAGVSGPKPPERFSILTYNVLHGLEVRGWSVRPSESEEVRRARLRLQVRQLALAQPDVILLQEVNPLPEMAEAYITALKREGLQYTEVHQVDACGIRHSGSQSSPG